MTENDLEQACIDWFRDLSWEYAHGETISPGGFAPERGHYNEVVLAPRLRSALERLNLGINASVLDDAEKKVRQFAGQSLVEANRDLYVWLRDGIPVEVEEDGHRRQINVMVFDWTDPTRNDWLIVNQFTVKGSKTVRPDMVAFVNGLPLAVIELKNPADEKADVYAAFNQIGNYKNEIPQLFEPNVVCVISDGTVARMGSISADSERFMPWRAANGIDHPEQHLELEVLVKGLFDKQTFLTYFHHFIAFQTSGAGTFKVIAGYHQYHGVLRGVERALNSIQHRHDGKGGVMWFTQGSGKSLLAVFYVGMLRERPELENPTIVVVTDRKDLDGQLFETFASCRIPLRTTPVQANDRAELKKLLSEQVAGGIFFTTIQKFSPEKGLDTVEQLSSRSNIIVICDEAHRTQYGFKSDLDKKGEKYRYGLAKYMHDALPNALYLGLTGTPISENDRDTEAVFGTYVDIYDVLASQQDGTTVPIHYEQRIIDLAVNQAELGSLDEELEELLEDDPEEQNSRTISALSRLESIAMADGRLEKLAEDLVKHWDERLEAIDGKGMIVAISRRAAVAFYDEIIKCRPEWHAKDIDKGGIKVVMTSPASDPSALRVHATTPQEKKLLEKRIKDPDDPLKLVIVRDMWLTGFDAPCLHTLYVDKPMRGQGLMQAVARVNRVWKDKPGGLVVDYIGIGEELKAAIAQYTRARGGENRGEPVEFIEEALTILKETIAIIRDMLHGVDLTGIATDAKRALVALPIAMNHLVKLNQKPDTAGKDEKPPGVKRFLDQVTKLSKAQALAGTHRDALALRNEIAFYQAVKAGLVKFTSVGVGKSKVEKEAAMRQIVAKGVLVNGVTDLYKTLGIEKPDISVLDEIFLAKLAEIPQKNLAAELLQRLINDEIQSRGRRNTTQAQKFSKKLTDAIQKYTNRGLTSAQVIEELIKLAQEIAADKPPPGMTEDEFAFYEALRENESAVREMGDPILKALAHELTDKLRKSATIDWQKRETARARMRLLVKVLLTKYKYPPDKQPDAVEKVIAQAELYADLWAVEGA
ncbi:type I restriction endonuclease subunit R [Ferrovum myxofaciens]|uniref:type I restriction endonuclease subunit R n=1 Tax=Ferrovum myxofaciens TaxID=416213 RepID=UPI0004E1A7D7|nr:type I restriction endonuclease subunit R [Ferrovum myxofaciens]